MLLSELLFVIIFYRDWQLSDKGFCAYIQTFKHKFYNNRFNLNQCFCHLLHGRYISYTTTGTTSLIKYVIMSNTGGVGGGGGFS